MSANDGYRLSDELARHASKERFVRDELCGACRVAGERLGREEARAARFRSAAEMVELWGDLDLPARVAPYALRDARLGYIEGYAGALVSGNLSPRETTRAAEARWGGGWQQRLEAARQRANGRTPANGN